MSNLLSERTAAANVSALLTASSHPHLSTPPAQSEHPPVRRVSSSSRLLCSRPLFTMHHVHGLSERWAQQRESIACSIQLVDMRRPELASLHRGPMASASSLVTTHIKNKRACSSQFLSLWRGGAVASMRVWHLCFVRHISGSCHLRHVYICGLVGWLSSDPLDSIIRVLVNYAG